jgi:hypothetical protein
MPPVWELMPDRLAYRTQRQGRHNCGSIERSGPDRSARVASFDHPLQPGHPYCCGLPHSGQNFELRGIDFPHS